MSPYSLYEALGLTETQSLVPALTKHLEGITREGLAPGAAVSIVSNGQVATAFAGERKSGSLVDADTRFSIGCLIKPLLALIALEAHVRGQIDIDRGVDTYLPELRGSGADGLTLRHLLSHTGGYTEPAIRRGRWELTWESFVEDFRSAMRHFPAGEVWSYTHTGHAIVERILAAATGADPLQMIMNCVLAPLGIHPVSMADTASDESAASPHMQYPKTGKFLAIRIPPETGFFRCSISDLCLSIPELNVYAALLGGRINVPGISEDAHRLWRTAHVPVPQPVSQSGREAVPTFYGLGVAHYGPTVGHTGSYVGSTCSVRYDVQTGVSIVVAINCWNPIIRDGLAARLMDLVVTQAPPSLMQPGLLGPAPMAGHYRRIGLGGGEAMVSIQGDAVYCDLVTLGEEPLHIELALDGSGALRTIGPAKAPTIVAVQHPSRAEPYLMVGLSAYARI